MAAVAVAVGISTKEAVAVGGTDFGVGVAGGSLVGSRGVGVESEVAVCVSLPEQERRLSIKTTAMSFPAIPG
jgi:hypothetical protein